MNDLWNGEHYKENSSPQQKTAEKILGSIDLKNDYKILDIGCGDGKITSSMALKVSKGKIIGIDPSPSMIKEAQKSYQTIDNLLFYEGKAEDFKFGETFDFIFSFYSLHWIKDKIKVFKNIADHLNSKGQFIFVTSGRENPLIAKVFSSEKWLPQLTGHGKKFHSSDENKTEKMLKDSGFGNIEIKVENWSQFYNEKNDLLQWIMSWVPFATGLNKQDSLEFSQEILRNLEKDSIKSGINNRIEMITEMLVIKAQK